jgi:hypothetical protein
MHALSKLFERRTSMGSGTFLNRKGFLFEATFTLMGKEPMKTSDPRNRVSARAHRMDPRQQTRCSLALILLMGLATLSVLATTQTLSARDTSAVHFYSIR